MYKQGSIVLVPFPFTDLSGDKVRPALILNNEQIGDDVLVCFISSVLPKKPHHYEIIIKIEEKSFIKTGLKVTSVIKIHKIATLDKKVILGELGSIDGDTMNSTKKILKTYCGI